VSISKPEHHVRGGSQLGCDLGVGPGLVVGARAAREAGGVIFKALELEALVEPDLVFLDRPAQVDVGIL